MFFGRINRKRQFFSRKFLLEKNVVKNKQKTGVKKGGKREVKLVEKI